MSDIIKISRRSILSTFVHGAAVMALPVSIASAPTIARAANTIPRRARRVLVLNLSGGVRSSACFLASGSKSLNPWGRIEKGPFPVGRLLDDHLGTEQPPPKETYQLSHQHFTGLRLTPFRDLVQSNAFSVVGTWDPGRGDHERSLRVMASGSTSADAPGLVVKLFAALSAANTNKAATTEETPPFVIGEAKAFAVARDTFARFAAVDIADPTRLPSSATGAAYQVAAMTGAGFVPGGKNAPLADPLSPKMGAAGRELTEMYALHHRTSRRLGALLSSPALSVMRDSGDASALGSIRGANNKVVPLTNEMVREVVELPSRFGAIRGGYAHGGRESSPASSVALAIRLLQIGSPAVAIDVPGFDSHSGEKTSAVGLYRQLGGLWSGLHFLLSRIADPAEPNVSMLDRTLVVTTSEMGRDPGMPGTGFNGGEGSDHGSHPACYYVAHAVMGAGVAGGRLHGGVSTDTFDARRESAKYAPQRLLATIGHALGIDMREPQWSFEGAQPIEELWGKA
jgi:uncharacterized protein (DUF1501 family)